MLKWQLKKQYARKVSLEGQVIDEKPGLRDSEKALIFGRRNIRQIFWK